MENQSVPGQLDLLSLTGYQPAEDPHLPVVEQIGSTKLSPSASAMAPPDPDAAAVLSFQRARVEIFDEHGVG